MKQLDLPFGRINEFDKFTKVPKKVIEAEIHNLFNIILLQPAKGYMSYAHTYAKTGLEMRGRELRTQVLYVLNNLQGWKGDIARGVKVQLKKLRKEL